MIVRYESTLQTGEAFRVRCVPVDPADLFRGRYVRIKLETFRVPLDEGQSFDEGKPAFIEVEKDEQGFMRVVDISTERPKQGIYFEAKGWVGFDGETKERFVEAILPFDRYYMTEELAPQAERAYRNAPTEAFAVIRVRDGFAALEQLYFDGLPVSEFLEQRSRPE